MTNDENTEWLNEKIEKMPNNNGMYRLACLMLGKKKMTYNEMFLLLYGLHKGKCKTPEENNKLKERIVNELFEIRKSEGKEEAQ